MGRTGRKRAGNITLLLMKGREEEKFLEAKDNYQKMQQLICEGSRFAFRHDISTRIVPREIKPEVDKRHIDIPVENTQTTDLPEPRKTAAGLRRKPSKKKFNMPDGVETGFSTVSSMFNKAAKRGARAPVSHPVEINELAEVPELGRVALSDSQTRGLNTLYRDLPFGLAHVQEISLPALGAYPAKQRSLGRTFGLAHGGYTKRCVKLCGRLGKGLERDPYPHVEECTPSWENLPVRPFADDTDGESEAGPAGAAATNKRQRSENMPGSKKRVGEAGRNTGGRGQHAPNSKPSRLKQKPRTVSVLDGYAEETSPEEGNDDSEGAGTPLPKRSRPNPKSRIGTGRSGRAAHKRTGDQIEDYGEDCMRTSDMDETDGSDSGGDLVGFIVGDDELISSVPKSTSPTSPGSSSHVRARNRRNPVALTPRQDSPGFGLAHSAQAQETDDDSDLPDIRQLGSSVQKEKRRYLSDIDLEDRDHQMERPREIGTRKRLAPKQRRLLVEDSDEND